MTDSDLSAAVALASHKIKEAIACLDDELSLADCDYVISESKLIGDDIYAAKAGSYGEALRISDRCRSRAMDALSDARAALKAIGA